jgi:hypothetical protein
MSLNPFTSQKSKLLVAGLAVLFLCAIAGAVFAAWVNNGPQILLSLGSSALAWCF